MKIGLCQPYLFPYLGFYQLVNEVDVFVIYDDANFIKNRYSKGNTILSNGKRLDFSMPVIGASSFKTYKELEYQSNVKKVSKTIQYSYSKCKAYSSLFPIIEKVIGSSDRRVSVVNAKSISAIFDWAGLQKEVLFSSDLVYNRSAGASEKIIEIVKYLGGTKYVNPQGGIDLYDNEYFFNQGVKLSFLESNPKPYEQLKSSSFQENLSIIDLCMHEGRKGFIEKLSNCKVVRK